MKERETFASRLGFVLISAGCAIGLGNVWRFPYIVGQYGGAAFVLIYLAFLVVDVYKRQVEGVGWIKNAIYFDGKSWTMMDPTFVSTGKGSASIMKYVTTPSNYSQKYAY